MTADLEPDIPCPFPFPCPCPTTASASLVSAGDQDQNPEPRAPKGRQKLAWGVSPRNATTPLVSALKGRQNFGIGIGIGIETSPKGATDISLGREPQERHDPSRLSPEGATEISLGREPQDLDAAGLAIQLALTSTRPEPSPGVFFTPANDLSSRPSAPRASGGIPSRQALAFPVGIPPLGPRRPSVGMTDNSSDTRGAFWGNGAWLPPK